MKNYLCLIVLVISSSSSSAYAGQAERAKQAEINAGLKTSAATFKKNCACKEDLKFDVKWDTYKNVDAMARIAMAGEKLAENSAAFCSDDESKKAVCVMKAMNLSFGAEPAVPQLKGGTIIGQTNDVRTLEWSEYIKLLDK